MGGLLAAVGIVALFLLVGGGGGAKGKGKIQTKCLTVDDLPEPLRSEVKKALDTETDPVVLDGVAVDIDKNAPECGAISKRVRDRAAELRGKKTGGTTTTKKFTPGGVKDKKGLIKTAWAIAKARVPADYAASHPKSVKKDGTWTSLSAFCGCACTSIAADGSPYARSNTQLVMALQDSAGISVDGKCGHETEKAWSYGLSAGSP